MLTSTKPQISTRHHMMANPFPPLSVTPHTTYNTQQDDTYVHVCIYILIRMYCVCTTFNYKERSRHEIWKERYQINLVIMGLIDLGISSSYPIH